MRAARTPPRRSASPRTLRGACAAAWLALAAAGAALPARAEDLTGRAELTYGQDEFITSSRDYFRQAYTLTYRRQISQPTSYQLTLRYQDDRGSTRVDGRDDARLHLYGFEPSGAIDHRMEEFGFGLSFRRNEESAYDPGVNRYATRTIERYSGSVNFRPFERGDVEVAGDRLAYHAVGVDSLDQRAALAFRYTTDALRLVNELRVHRTDDGVRGVSRTSMGPRLTAFYSGTLAQRYSMTAQYIVDYLVTEQDARPAAAQSVPVEVDAANGLYAVDSLPADTDPLAAEPRLVDRVFDVSAGISIGPGGASFQNLGLDMGRSVALDELRVSVRDRNGQPVPFDRTISWTAWASQDGLRWAQLSGVAADYSVGLSAYVIGFARTPARYFKVVNFREHAFEAFVTELQGFVQETVLPASTVTTSAVRQSAGLSVSARPTAKVLILYSGLLNADLVSAQGIPDRWFTDVTGAANAKLGPYGDFLFGVGQTFALARNPGDLTQTTWATTGSARFQPIPRYDTTLDLHASFDRFERPFPALHLNTSNVGASLANRFDPYDSLRLGVTAGANRQDLATTGVIDYLVASAYARSDLVRNLVLRLDASVQRIVSERGDLPSLDQVPAPVRISTYEIYTGEARWQASVQVFLRARMGWAAADAGEGVIQDYQVTWSPFPGGTLHLSFDYNQDVDPLTGQSYRRIAALPRWDINRRAILQLSYNDVRGTGPTRVRQQNLFLTLTLSL